jgi:hypothetical protein
MRDNCVSCTCHAFVMHFERIRHACVMPHIRHACAMHVHNCVMHLSYKCHACVMHLARSCHAIVMRLLHVCHAFVTHTSCIGHTLVIHLSCWRVCVCVCVCVCARACVCTLVGMSLRMGVCWSARWCACVCVCVRVSTCACVCVCMWQCARHLRLAPPRCLVLFRVSARCSRGLPKSLDRAPGHVLGALRPTLAHKFERG